MFSKLHIVTKIQGLNWIPMQKRPQYQRAISCNDYCRLPEEESSPQPAQEQNSTISFSSITHVSIPVDESKLSIAHREIKPDRQRFRWNLIFNLLIWIIYPLPIWLPFVSNQIAIYVLPSIQAVFVLIWSIISFLAARNAFILYR